jgi:CRP-like cAMP-binding protein
MVHDPERLRLRAADLERKGKHDKALALYRALAESDAQDPTGWTLLGEKELAHGDAVRAAQAFFRATDLCARAGRLREALDLSTQALAADRHHGAARRLQAILHRRVQRMDGLEVEDEDLPPRLPKVIVEFEALGIPADRPAAEGGGWTPLGDLADDGLSDPTPLIRRTDVRMLAQRSFTPPVPNRPAGAPGLTASPVAPMPPSPEAPAADRAAAAGGAPAGMPDRAAESPAHEAAADEVEISVVPTESPSNADGGALEHLVLANRLPCEAVPPAADILLDDQPSEPADAAPPDPDWPLASPLLGALDNATLEELLEHARHDRRAAGEVIFRQGEPGEVLYVILRGQVRVVRELVDEPPRELARLGAGAFFGEMALLCDEPRNAAVVASAECDLLALDRPAVTRLIERNPDVLATLLRFFRARLVGTLVETSPLFEGLSAGERRGLVARFRLRELPPGVTVIREGQPSDALSIALAGRLIVVQRHHATERLLAVLTAGDVFGEMSLLSGGPAVATIRTISKVWALALPRRDFEHVVTSRPALRQRLDRLAAERRAQCERIRNGEAEYDEGRVEPL